MDTAQTDRVPFAYELTNKCLALRAMRDWGLKWEPGTEARLEPA